MTEEERRDHRDDVRRAYDEIAPAYDRIRSASPEERRLLEAFADRLPDDGRVLDAGCGAGDPVTAFLADRGPVTGLDVSGGQLALARDRAPDAALVRGDMTVLPFADSTFDGLCSAYAVVHVPWAHQAATFGEFRRVLGPGAPLLVTVGSEDWEGSTENWLDAGAEMHWSQPGPNRTDRLLADAGFETVRRWRVPDGDGEKVWFLAQADEG